MPGRPRWSLPTALLAIYVLAVFFPPPGATRLAVATAMNAVVPLLANVGLLMNTHSPYRRRNLFWIFLALSCLLWVLGVLLGSSGSVLGQAGWSRRSLADGLFFLHPLPWLAALWLRPHRRRMAAVLRQGGLDMLLLLTWWGYLYAFWVVPPALLDRNPNSYLSRYLLLAAVEVAVLLAALCIFVWTTQQHWRWLYGQIAGAALLQNAGWLLMCLQVHQGRYVPGAWVDLPILASFLWLGMTGWQAHGLTLVPAEGGRLLADSHSAARLAMVGILMMPLLGAWNSYLSRDTERVRHYRLELTLAGILVGLMLVTWRQARTDRARQRLIAAIRESIEKTHRLQVHLAHTEKLAQLGELAGAAAHAIHNPLQAILGYVELLLENPQSSEPVRSLAMKMRTQAHRIRSLVASLQSFARQVPSGRTLLDVNELLSGTAMLREAELASRRVQVVLELSPELPFVRADRGQLLQVFSELISNAAEAMQPHGGQLQIRTRRAGSSVIVEFADTGPGVKNPERVFDPFFTTKGVGRGSGLGLSMCFGIVQEHGGQIRCQNRPQRGALFQVELPAVLLPASLRGVLQSLERAS